MSVQSCLVLLALCSLAAASVPDCKELIKPQQNHTQVIGKWIFHASISESKEVGARIKVINSSWISVSPVSDSEKMSVRWADRINEKCTYGALNFTFSLNSSQTLENNATVFNGQYLKSCPDCLVWEDTITENEKGRSLYIYTKTGSLAESHLETFKKQASCLNLQDEMYLLATTNLCPDAPDPKEAKE